MHLVLVEGHQFLGDSITATLSQYEGVTHEKVTSYNEFIDKLSTSAVPPSHIVLNLDGHLGDVTDIYKHLAENYPKAKLFIHSNKDKEYANALLETRKVYLPPENIVDQWRLYEFIQNLMSGYPLKPAPETPPTYGRIADLAHHSPNLAPQPRAAGNIGADSPNTMYINVRRCGLQ